MKTITIQVDFPHTIRAFDSEGQWVYIKRLETQGPHSIGDFNVCTIVSSTGDISDPNEMQTGKTTWQEAFLFMARFFNCTSA